MGFGWLCALAQADAPEGEPRIAGMIAIFVMALASLIYSAMRLRREERLRKWVMLALIGLQSALCLYALVAEFAL